MSTIKEVNELRNGMLFTFPHQRNRELYMFIENMYEGNKLVNCQIKTLAGFWPGRDGADGIWIQNNEQIHNCNPYCSVRLLDLNPETLS